MSRVDELSRAELIALIEAQQQAIAARDAKIDELTEKLEVLHFRVSQMSRRIYANTSERHDQNQQVIAFAGASPALADLFAHDDDDDDDDDDPPGGGSRRERRARERERNKQRKRGRQALPDHLDVVEERIDPPPEARVDADGNPFPVLREVVSERLDYRAGGWVKRRTIRPVYGRPFSEHNERVIAELPPQIVERGLPSDGTVVQVILAKYRDHTPLYRQAQQLRDAGIAIGRSQLMGWVGAAAKCFAPVHAALADEVRAAPYLHTDDVPVRLLAPGRGRCATARLWIYNTPSSAHFAFTPDRRGCWPQDFLRDYRGAIVDDAFPGYAALFADDDRIEIACWAHIRRKFYDAFQAGEARAGPYLDAIRALYRIERDTRDHRPDARQAERRRAAQPVLAAMKRDLDHDVIRERPRSGLGRAVHYALERWPAAVRYLDDGRWPIDNNPAENAIRPIVLGRKNYLFLGSQAGGAWAAIHYSVIASCRLAGIAPRRYLLDVARTLAHDPRADAAALTPQAWKAARSQAAA